MLKSWKPANSAHSIQQVTARIRFGQQVTDIPWQRIQKQARGVADSYGLNAAQTVEDVSIGLSPNGPSASQQQTVGYEFLRLETPNFFSDKLVITREDVNFEEWRYTRWNALREKLQDVLYATASTYISVVPLLSVDLEYVDIFEALVEDADCSEVLRKDSEYVAPAAYKPRDSWHSHIGYFDQPDTLTKRLVNVDIEAAQATRRRDGKQTRLMRFRTSMSDLFNQQGHDSLPLDDLGNEFFEQRFDELHVHLKNKLADILTEDAAATIALNG
ncbi:hypothetical protein [Pelagibacterium sp.]|uniref:hypothetical protein n=1 Tax=Pelagibacterium sp. TaxID=1967288 RepID=UPI003A929CF9